MKLFHSWKRWQLIALVCVVLTAVLTLVFVLQGGSGDTQPTGGTEGLQLATETLGDVTEPPETALSHTDLNMNRIFISKNFSPPSPAALRFLHNERTGSNHIF